MAEVLYPVHADYRYVQGRIERLDAAPDSERPGFVWIWRCKCQATSRHPSSNPSYARKGLNAHQQKHRGLQETHG